MSYSTMLTIMRGIVVDRATINDRFSAMLNTFLKENLHSNLVGDCAEYWNKNRTEVTEDDLLDYLHDKNYIIDDYSLRGAVFIGEPLYREDISYSDSGYRDLAAFTDLTSFDAPIWEFINKFFKDTKHRTYLINWVA